MLRTPIILAQESSKVFETSANRRAWSLDGRYRGLPIAASDRRLDEISVTVTELM